MASVSTNKGKNRRVIYLNSAGKRRILYLGKVSLRNAKEFSGRIQEIVNAQRLGQSLPGEIVEWLTILPLPTRLKLAAHGLAAAPVGRKNQALGGFFIAYFESLKVQANTLRTYKQTESSMLTHFGADCLLNDIGPLQCELWKQAMEKSGLAEATVARRVKTARRGFARAVRWKLIAENPLADLRGGSEANPSRMFFITEAAAYKVLDACPDIEWKVIFALSRWGGLRCPSEHLALRWTDVNFAEDRIIVRESKTKERLLPMFPELKPVLLEAFHNAKEGAEFVVTRYREKTQNLRTQLIRIIHNAGLAQWPKIFHNLRSTRQTELSERHPIQAVCAWIGNSEKIAKKHYLQVTDEHFKAAIMDKDQRDAHHDPATGENDRKESEAKRHGAQKSAIPDREPRSTLTPTGFKKSTKPRGKHGRPDEYDAQRDALSDVERMEAAQRAIDAYLGFPAPAPKEQA